MSALRFLPVCVVLLASMALAQPPAKTTDSKTSTTETGISVATSASAQKTYDDIQKTLGVVPEFLRAFPQAGIAGAWQEMKDLQLNPNTELSPKFKELIGLAVASTIPCEYCAYFHTRAAKLNGATDEEVKEAVAMAGLTRHWSSYLNGMQINKTKFRAEADQIIQNAKQKMQNPPKQLGGQTGTDQSAEPSASE